jgi:hypothetical protein
MCSLKKGMIMEGMRSIFKIPWIHNIQIREALTLKHAINVAFSNTDLRSPLTLL